MTREVALVLAEENAMAAIDIIKRRLKEDRVPDVPDEIGEKKKRPRAEERAILRRERK